MPRYDLYSVHRVQRYSLEPLASDTRSYVDEDYEASFFLEDLGLPVLMRVFSVTMHLDMTEQTGVYVGFDDYLLDPHSKVGGCYRGRG